MKPPALISLIVVEGVLSLGLASCINLPTLVQVARERQYGNGHMQDIQGAPAPACSGTYTTLATSGSGSIDSRRQHRNDLAVSYIITDLDVVNWSDRVKIVIAHHCNRATLARYSSATGQDALTALSGAASAAGWATSTASGLGLGALFVSTLGQVFDAKGDAALYDDAFNNIQDAENLYYFYAVGMTFRDKKVVSWNVTRGDIPSCHYLSANGEALQHRVIAIIKVLNAALTKKIPDLQDLKTAKGDTSQTQIQNTSVTTGSANNK